jgi:hypothetical protein
MRSNSAVLRKKKGSIMSKLYIGQIQKILKCDADHAYSVLNEMMCDGLDFSECTNREFKESAVYNDDIVKAKNRYNKDESLQKQFATVQHYIVAHLEYLMQCEAVGQGG